MRSTDPEPTESVSYEQRFKIQFDIITSIIKFQQNQNESVESNSTPELKLASPDSPSVFKFITYGMRPQSKQDLITMKSHGCSNKAVIQTCCINFPIHNSNLVGTKPTLLEQTEQVSYLPSLDRILYVNNYLHRNQMYRVHPTKMELIPKS